MSHSVLRGNKNSSQTYRITLLIFCHSYAHMRWPSLPGPVPFLEMFKMICPLYSVGDILVFSVRYTLWNLVHVFDRTIQILQAVWCWWVTLWVVWLRELCSPSLALILAWSASSSPRPLLIRLLFSLWITTFLVGKFSKPDFHHVDRMREHTVNIHLICFCHCCRFLLICQVALECSSRGFT